MTDREKYIDVDSALNRVRGNKVLYKKMLGMFLGGTEFSQFEEAIAAGDNAKAGDVAHAIKGMTGNLSLTAIYEDSMALMQQLRHGDADPALVQHFREAYEQTLTAVNEVIAELA